MKHTPGPWKVFSTPYLTIWPRTKDGSEVPISEANAHLIAAAPEMIEALKDAVENCPCSVHERFSGHRTNCHALEWQEIVDKAEGN